jgi:NADH:ubiquinone oxidoreductase subunit 5 (subunit L)/multisubunit Na+/H+ antiporter MnhA subunit
LSYEALLTSPYPGGFGWLLPSLAVAGSLLTVAYSLVIVYGIFFGRPPKTLTDHLHEPTIGMLMAPALLAGMCVMQGASPLWLDSALLTPAVFSVTGPQHLPGVKLWHGLNLPALMSLVTLLGGTALYVVGGSALGLPLTKVRTFSFNAVYDRGMEALDDLGALFTKVFQSGYLKFSVMMTLGFLVLSFTYPFIVKAGARWGALDLAPVEPYEAVLVALLMVGALAVTLATQPSAPY